MVGTLMKLIKLPFQLLAIPLALGVVVGVVDYTVGWNEKTKPMRTATVSLAANTVGACTPIVEFLNEKIQHHTPPRTRPKAYSFGFFGIGGMVKQILVNWLSSPYVPLLILTYFGYRKFNLFKNEKI